MESAHDQAATGVRPPPGGGGARVGPYRLIRERGRGGLGTVLLAVRGDDAFTLENDRKELARIRKGRSR